MPILERFISHFSELGLFGLLQSTSSSPALHNIACHQIQENWLPVGLGDSSLPYSYQTVEIISLDDQRDEHRWFPWPAIMQWAKLPVGSSPEPVNGLAYEFQGHHFSKLVEMSDEHTSLPSGNPFTRSNRHRWWWERLMCMLVPERLSFCRKNCERFCYQFLILSVLASGICSMTAGM